MELDPTLAREIADVLQRLSLKGQGPDGARGLRLARTLSMLVNQEDRLVSLRDQALELLAEWVDTVPSRTICDEELPVLEGQAQRWIRDRIDAHDVGFEVTLSDGGVEVEVIPNIDDPPMFATIRPGLVN